MQLRKNGIDLHIPDDQVVNLVLLALSEDEMPVQPIIQTAGITLDLPAIGEYWKGQGGKFTGLLPGKDDIKYFALVTGPLFEPAAKYAEMRDKAAAVEVDGHKDFRLPFKAELSLQKATIPQLFRTDDWYWSIERHPANELSAYAQDFKNGSQDYCLTDNTCLACAVRIVPIR